MIKLVTIISIIFTLISTSANLMAMEGETPELNEFLSKDHGPSEINSSSGVLGFFNIPQNIPIISQHDFLTYSLSENSKCGSLGIQIIKENISDDGLNSILKKAKGDSLEAKCVMIFILGKQFSGDEMIYALKQSVDQNQPLALALKAQTYINATSIQARLKGPSWTRSETERLLEESCSLGSSYGCSQLIDLYTREQTPQSENIKNTLKMAAKNGLLGPFISASIYYLLNGKDSSAKKAISYVLKKDPKLHALVSGELYKKSDLFKELILLNNKEIPYLSEEEVELMNKLNENIFALSENFKKIADEYLEQAEQKDIPEAYYLIAQRNQIENQEKYKEYLEKAVKYKDPKALFFTTYEIINKDEANHQDQIEKNLSELYSKHKLVYYEIAQIIKQQTLNSRFANEEQAKQAGIKADNRFTYVLKLGMQQDDINSFMLFEQNSLEADIYTGKKINSEKVLSYLKKSFDARQFYPVIKFIDESSFEKTQDLLDYRDFLFKQCVDSYYSPCMIERAKQILNNNKLKEPAHAQEVEFLLGFSAILNDIEAFLPVSEMFANKEEFENMEYWFFQFVKNNLHLNGIEHTKEKLISMKDKLLEKNQSGKGSDQFMNLIENGLEELNKL